MNRLPISLLLVLAATSNLVAGEVVIEGGMRFDASSGQLVENRNLVLRDGRIAAIDAKLERREGLVVIDATGSTILPGLFDLHVHVGVPGGSMTNFVAVDPADNLSSQLMCGVTTVVDLHGDERTIFELRERSRTSPWLARLLCVGGAFTAPGGHGSQFGFPAHLVTSEDDVTKGFAALLPQKPDAIKVILEHGDWIKTLPKLPTLDDEQFDSVVRGAHAAKLPAFAHVWTLAEAKSAVRAGADALVHGVFTEAIDDELIALMKERGTAYVPTLSVVMGPRRLSRGEGPYAFDLADQALPAAIASAVRSKDESSWAKDFDVAGGDALWLENLRRVHAARIPIGTGTDAGNPLTPHGPSLLLELELFAAAGLPNADVLEAATLQSARILRREQESGSLEVGKLADAVIVRGDPLSDIRALRDIALVIKDGAIVDREALARRIDDPSLASEVTRVEAPLFDDFEDGDLKAPLGVSWEVATDSAARGDSKASLAVESGVLKVRGTLGTKSPFGGFAGARIDLGSGGKRRLDLSQFTGIEIRLKGVPRAIDLVLHRAAVTDFNVFAVNVPLTEEWVAVRIPFADIRQVGFGKKVAPGVGDVTGFTIEARDPPRAKGGPFEFEVDSISFYRDA